MNRKIEIARRQLGTALALYLQDQDPVSVHCLAGGGCELIEYYAKEAGAKPLTSHIMEVMPDIDIKRGQKAAAPVLECLQACSPSEWQRTKR